MAKESVMVKIAEIAKSSVGNVRKELGNLAELAASIKAHGIIQPVTLRKMGEAFEVVCGHRRIAAAKIAKLAEVPAIVGEYLDAEVIALQLIENLQREDIHPMDEAIGFFRLREDHDHSVEDIIKATGKTKAYIYASMKLIELSDNAQAEFRKNKFDTSVALYIARVSTPEGQRKACKLVSKPDVDGDKMPAREAFGIIDEIKEHIELDEKWEKIKAKAKESFAPVLSDNAANKVFSAGFVLHNSNYVDLDACDYEHPQTLKYREILKKGLPTITHAQNPLTRKAFELISKGDLKKAVKAIYGEAGYKAKQAPLSPEVQRSQEKTTAFRKFRAMATPLVNEKAITGPSVNFLRAVLTLICDGVTFGTFNRVLLKAYERKEKDFRASIATMNEKELRDELFILLTAEANTERFANVCKLLKVSESSLDKIKAQISDEARAKALVKKQREKVKAAKEKAALEKEKEKPAKPNAIKKKAKSSKAKPKTKKS